VVPCGTLLASANGEQRFQSRAAITTARSAEIEVELRPPDLVTMCKIFAIRLRSAVRCERSAWLEGSAIDTRRATAPVNNPC
jgi:hypothetical protein